MDIKGLECDLLHVLQNDDRNVLKKWLSSCRDFRAHVAAKIKEELVYEKDCTRKKTTNDRRTSELQREMDTVKSNVDAIVLQQKITDKKISNVTKSQESLRDELEMLKAQRETLSLEMVDLELEMETRKRNKILQWDAIRRACRIYKVNLDAHISLEEKEDCQQVKFSFFVYNDATKDKYFVLLSCNNNHWKVEQIEPNLRRQHFDQLCVVTDSPQNFKISDLTLFLCQVRSIFLKHYMKIGKR